MNEMKELELQLRSWAPRRPSEKLEGRIFARAAAAPITDQPPPISQAIGFHLRWLAPAAAALVLLCAVSNRRDGGPSGGGTNSGALLAIISSNQSAYLPFGSRPAQNGPPAATFRWTNDSAFTSSVRSLSTLRARN